MALATVSTKSKNTITRTSTPKASAKAHVGASSLLDPTISPYDFLSERITNV